MSVCLFSLLSVWKLSVFCFDSACLLFGLFACLLYVCLQYAVCPNYAYCLTAINCMSVVRLFAVYCLFSVGNVLFIYKPSVCLLIFPAVCPFPLCLLIGCCVLSVYRLPGIFLLFAFCLLAFILLFVCLLYVCLPSAVCPNSVYTNWCLSNFCRLGLAAINCLLSVNTWPDVCMLYVCLLATVCILSAVNILHVCLPLVFF